MRRLLAPLLCLALLVPAGAEDDVREPVRRAYAAYRAVLGDPPLAPREGDRTEYHRAVRAWQARVEEQKQGFVSRFEATRWEAWTAGQDAAIVESGLIAVSEAAFEQGDGARAVTSLERLLDQVGSERARLVFHHPDLVLAYVMAGRIDRATSRARELLDASPVMHRPRLLVQMGDLALIGDDRHAAGDLYRRADAAVPDELRNCCGAEASAGRDARVKLRALVAPPLPTEPAWTEGALLEGPTTTALPHIIAFVDLMRSWDASRAAVLCRESRDRGHGIPIVVATPESDTGDPKPDGETARDPRYEERAKDTTPRQRARDVRKNLGVDAPVIGFRAGAWPGLLWPGLLWMGDHDVLVDGNGRVVFVRGPSEDRTLLYAAAWRLRDR